MIQVMCGSTSRKKAPLPLLPGRNPCNLLRVSWVCSLGRRMLKSLQQSKHLGTIFTSLMKTLTLAEILFFGLLSMNMSCENTSDSINPKQCIRATVVYTGCAGTSFVQVHNAKLGTEWSYSGKTWDNVIRVNLPKTIKADSTVSFALVRQVKSSDDACADETCNTNIFLPENLFCVSNISAGKCSVTDAK